MQWQGGEKSNQSDKFGRMFPSLFGSKDPFDDPFFTSPARSLFGSSIFSRERPDDIRQARKSKEPVIEELLSDDETESEEKEEVSGGGDSGWANKNPLVEHPDDEGSDAKISRNNSKELMLRTERNKTEVTQPKTNVVSFKRVSYGGIDGTYYTATTTQRTGDDGVTMEESKQADKTTGQATHRISRGIHDKGHSVTRKLESDGKVGTTQTLHNLDEDELAGFEQAWKGKSDKNLQTWNDTVSFQGTSGSRHGQRADWGTLSDPFRDHFGRIEERSLNHDSQAGSRGKPKKTIRINIE